MFERCPSRNQLLHGALTVAIPTNGFSLINEISALPCMPANCKGSFLMTVAIAV